MLDPQFLNFINKEVMPGVNEGRTHLVCWITMSLDPNMDSAQISLQN
jgi:hypothetical protein